MPKKKNSTGAQAIRTAQRQAEALEYRLQGHSLRAIGKEMRVSHVHVGRLLEGALQAIVAGNVKELRKLEVMRLDAMQTVIFADAAAGNLRAIDAVLKIMDRRCRILGLYAPERKEITGKDGKDLPAPVAMDLEAARSAVIEALQKAGISAHHDSAPAKPVLQ